MKANSYRGNRHGPARRPNLYANGRRCTYAYAQRHHVIGIPAIAGAVRFPSHASAELAGYATTRCPQCGHGMWVGLPYLAQMAQGTTRAVCVACAVPRGTPGAS